MPPTEKSLEGENLLVFCLLFSDFSVPVPVPSNPQGVGNCPLIKSKPSSSSIVYSKFKLHLSVGISPLLFKFLPLCPVMIEDVTCLPISTQTWPYVESPFPLKKGSGNLLLSSSVFDISCWWIQDLLS